MVQQLRVFAPKPDDLDSIPETPQELQKVNTNVPPLLSLYNGSIYLYLL